MKVLKRSKVLHWMLINVSAFGIRDLFDAFVGHKVYILVT